jgi:hypothetical protein
VSGNVDGQGDVSASDEAGALEADTLDATQRPPSGDAGPDDAAAPVGDAKPPANVGDASPALGADAAQDATLGDGTSDATSSDLDGTSTTADAAAMGTFDVAVPADGAEVFDEPPCNTVDYAAAPWVATAYVDAGPPAMTGGAIVGGTYYLSSDTVYGTACVVTSIASKEVVVIASDVGNPTSGTFLGAGQSELGHRDDADETYSTDGGLLTTTTACTSPVWSGQSVGTAPYTATPTELVFQSAPTSCQLEITVYTKQ